MIRPRPHRRVARVAATSVITVSVAAAVGGAPPGPRATPTPDRDVELAMQRVLDVAEVRAVVLADAEGAQLTRFRRPSDAGPHNLKSASKSLVALLAGIAIEHGVVPGLDTPVADLLPDYRELVTGGSRDQMTLRHLLTMTAGLESTSGDRYGAWVTTDDWVRSALSRPVVARPGSQFIYSTGSTHVAAAALSEALGADLATWARTVLFEPLGISDVRWSRSPTGRVFGGNNLAMRPEDLARVGSVLIAGGRWHGREVVPAGWIDASAGRHADGWPDRYGAYGIGWWLSAPGEMLAVGYGGQFLLVDRSLDRAVVVTATPEGKDAAWDRNVLGRMRVVLETARGTADD